MDEKSEKKLFPMDDWFPQMEVEYPAEDETDRQRERILEAALPETSFFERLKNMYLGAGLKTVFYHCGSAWLLMLFLYMGLCWFCWMARRNTEMRMGIFFLAFPLCYLTFWFVCCCLEEQDEVVELKNSMHYTLSYIMSLRMFYSGILSIFLDLFLLSVVDGYGGTQMWKMMSVGVSSIFLFAGAALYLYQKAGRGICIGILILCWLVVSVFMVRFRSVLLDIFFEQLPLAVHIVVAVGSLIIFALYIRKVERKDAYSFAC